MAHQQQQQQQQHNTSAAHRDTVRINDFTGEGPNNLPVTTPDPALGVVHHWFAELAGHFQRTQESLEGLRVREPWRDTTVLSANPYTFRRRGYRHVRILLPGATTLIIDAGIGAFNWVLTAGWNVVDLPDGSVISMAAGTSANAIIECLDSDVGPAWHA